MHSGCPRHAPSTAGGSGDAADALAKSALAASPPKAVPARCRGRTCRVRKDWSRVTTLIDEQKFEEARALCSTIRAAAQRAGNGEEWTEALIKEVQLQIALHGYETAVRLLRTESWPRIRCRRWRWSFYYAHSDGVSAGLLVGDRPTRASRDAGTDRPQGLEQDQIYSEAQRAYARIFARRDELSGSPSRCSKTMSSRAAIPTTSAARCATP